MFDIEPPSSKETLAPTLSRLHDEIVTYLEAMPTQQFVTPQGEAWSPAGHLRHLVKSVKAVAYGMGMPKLALALRFGVGFGGSRSFGEIRDVYLQAIDDGRARATGRYASSSEIPDGTTPEAWRASLLDRWVQAGEGLAKALGRWSEGALDRHRLPHPILGKMTVREMLFFTAYHNAHHARRIHERAGGVAD